LPHVIVKNPGLFVYVNQTCQLSLWEIDIEKNVQVQKLCLESER
jgi:hypothetical protein